MKISVDIDCTPEEARRFMGLPDMAPVHGLYMDKLKDMMGDGINAETMDKMVRAWAPMGDAGMNAWKGLVDQLTGSTNKG